MRPARKFTLFRFVSGIVVSLALLAWSLPAGAQRPDSAAVTGRTTAGVVVLGFDGVDPRLVERWMNEGHLPNLDRLRREGTFAPLGTTTPPQTPVSWTSFATGINPGRHGIFDFLSRDVKTYQPGYAMFDVGDKPVGLGRGNRLAGGALLALLAGSFLFLLLRRRGIAGLFVTFGVALAVFAAGYIAIAQYVPLRRPVVTRKTEGMTFWERAAEAGKKCRIIRVPAMFPPEPFEHGEIQSGLGVPDIRGTSGTYTFYTTERRQGSSANTEKGGVLKEVSFLNGETPTEILGPRNKLFDNPPDIQIPLHIKLNKTATPPSVTLTTSGQTLTLEEGNWSPWVSLEFPFNRFIKARGIARFHLVSVEPFGLYLSPINLDPEKPVLPISWPANFSADLAERFGLYKTIGWENDTFALDEEIIDDRAFLDDVDFTVDTWVPMMETLMTEGDLDLYVHVWDFTDRVGHMFWRTLDPEHPAADSLALLPYKDVVLETYKRMDDIVGRVMARISPGTMLLVCSDHGFNSWHKSVNYNTWLVKNGFMTLKSSGAPNAMMTLDDLFGQGQFWPNVDWTKTKAYALGLGDLYVNLRGRESQGAVDPADYEAVRDSLISGLTAFVDSTNGEHPVRNVYRREDVYNDFDPNLIPDLFIANNDRYRVSWQTSLGGIPPNLFEINDKKWSGDHCSLDAAITRGVFLSNRRLDASKATILDLHPTILSALGVTIPEGLDGGVIPALP
jgi:predicted AlkP superfamily phosphohydrolase/phosphomutase